MLRLRWQVTASTQNELKQQMSHSFTNAGKKMQKINAKKCIYLSANFLLAGMKSWRLIYKMNFLILEMT